MKKIVSLIISVWLVLLFSSVQAAMQTPEEVVMSTADAVLERLAADKEALDTDPGRIYGLINEVVIPHFDFVNMSKWVLGRTSWRTASEAQRTAFINEFRMLLVRTYTKALLEYSEQAIKYLPTEKKTDSRLVVVKTEINRPGSDALPIDYRMHVNEGKWKVVDVVVDNVSLVSIYRSSFSSEIKKNGFESLIDKLSKRNEQ